MEHYSYRVRIETLFGDIWNDITDARADSPIWLANQHDFILLMPGKLREISRWSEEASQIWQKIDALSPQARLALELEMAESTLNSIKEGDLLRETKRIFALRPPQIKNSIFQLSYEDFNELHWWCDQLQIISERYLLSLWQVDMDALNGTKQFRDKCDDN